MAPRPIDWRSEDGQWLLSNRLANAEVPPKYAEATWDKIQTGSAVKEYTRAIATHVGNGRGLIICGPVGTGKSSIAGVVAQEAVRSNLSILWQHVPTLVALLNHGERKDVHQTFKRALSPALLIWDDFWLGQLSPWAMEQIDRVVEFRYARNRPLVITTNVTRAALQGDESVARIVDRLDEKAFWITVNGESMRRTWKMENKALPTQPE